MDLAVLGRGTRGDLYPLLGISRRLLTSGHRVRLLEFDEYQTDVTDAGVPFVETGKGSQCADVFANVPAGPASPRTEWVTDRLYFEASVRSAPAFVNAIRSFQPVPEALIAPAHHLGAMLVAEEFKIPLVSVFLGTSVLESYDSRSAGGFSSPAAERTARLVDRFALPRLAELRRTLGLPENSRSFVRADADGGLILAPAPLADVPAYRPRTFETAGYPDYYGPDSLRFDDEVQRLLNADRGPLVVCTLGDGWAQALPDQLHSLFDRADQGAFRFAFVGGRIPGLRPGRNAVVTTKVNLGHLLRHADVSVNHGGMGSLVAALRNAVPSVMMSQWPDGRRNAAMLAAQGLGIDLGSAPTAADVLGAVDKVIGEAAFAARLTAAKAAVADDPDPADAVLRRLSDR